MEDLEKFLQKLNKKFIYRNKKQLNILSLNQFKIILKNINQIIFFI